MVTSEVALSSESLAVSRTTYVPALSTWIVVSRAPGSSNSTVPGPLTLLHVVVSCAGGAGSPSSSTVPCNGAVNHCDCTGPSPAGEKPTPLNWWVSVCPMKFFTNWVPSQRTRHSVPVNSSVMRICPTKGASSSAGAP